MKKIYAVRKLDTEDPWWSVVDLRVPGAALITEASVVYRTACYRGATDAAAALNRGESLEEHFNA